MEQQVQRLVDKTWGKVPDRKTTLASLVTKRLNELHRQKESSHHTSQQQQEAAAAAAIAAFVPMDGYHLSRAQLSAMPDPTTAHARRGAAFTFDDRSFLHLVTQLREPLLPESSKTVFAPSFDHALKDPVHDDIPIPASARIVVLEGNYLSLNRGRWKEAAGLMDELWFVEVGLETARRRLVGRHVKAGIARSEEEADRRVTENDLVNGEEILRDRLEVQEVVTSVEDEGWRPEAMGV
ncbi:MAG: hypothetical protein Q9190_001087 [Brigantiaea leucoxantha]